jgi:hypothetical protein
MRTKGWCLAVVAAMVAGAACSGGGARHAAPTTTAVKRSPPPAAGYLSAAPGDNVHSLSVWGWNGHRISTLTTSAAAECCHLGALSPDGTRLLLFDDRPGAAPSAKVTDVRGRVLARVADLGDASWADDSRHLCDLRPHVKHQGFADGPADLTLIDPGHGRRVVAQVPGYGPHADPIMLRCSVIDDEAILAVNFMGRTDAITAVRLSTGRTSTPRWAPRRASSDVVGVSGNGRYALEIGSGPRGVNSEIVDTSTGAIVGRQYGQPYNISWNGRLVVVVINGLILQVVNWRTGSLRYKSPAKTDPRPAPDLGAAVSARPHTDDLALTISELVGHDPNSAALWFVSASKPPKLVDNTVAKGVI